MCYYPLVLGSKSLTLDLRTQIQGNKNFFVDTILQINRKNSDFKRFFFGGVLITSDYKVGDGALPELKTLFANQLKGSQGPGIT